MTGHFYYKERELATKPVTHNTEIAARPWQISFDMCSLGKGSQEDVPAPSAWPTAGQPANR